MKIICHRGNLFGPNSFTENHPDQIDLCISKRYDVEIDLWVFDTKLFLGHDNPLYNISYEYLLERKNNLWIHCKNETALFQLKNSGLNYFWHENDNFTLTSHNFIWAFPNKQKMYDKNLVVLDFRENVNFERYQNLGVYAVCADYITI